MSIKSSLPHWTLAKQQPYGRNSRKWSIIFQRSVNFFVTFLFFVWWFWHGFLQFWLRHLKEQSKRKRKVTRKFGALAQYRHKSFCYWYYREWLKNFIFHLLLLFQWFCSLKQSIGTSEWILCNSHGEKIFKILQNQGN